MFDLALVGVLIGPQAGALVYSLVGALIRSLIGAPIGLLVGPLVGSMGVSANRWLTTGGFPGKYHK